MNKLKSLEDFEKEGLSLTKMEQSNVMGSSTEPVSESFFYKDTMRNRSADCDKYSRVDRNGSYLDDFYLITEVAQGQATYEASQGFGKL